MRQIGNPVNYLVSFMICVKNVFFFLFSNEKKKEKTLLGFFIALQNLLYMVLACSKGLCLF